jgi:hypothetical protein
LKAPQNDATIAGIDVARRDAAPISQAAGLVRAVPGTLAVVAVAEAAVLPEVVPVAIVHDLDPDVDPGRIDPGSGLDLADGIGIASRWLPPNRCRTFKWP